MVEAPIHLSVVIPSYNEMKNLQRGVLDHVLQFLRKQNFTWEIILTDDGSTDGTLQALKDFAQRDDRIVVVENAHAGKGPTVASGMLEAQGSYRLFTDFDQSTPIREVQRALEVMNDGYDVVIGSREVHGARRDEEPIHRHVMGRGFNFLVQLLALRGIQDSQCGFKLFTDQAAKKLFSSLHVYGDKEVRTDAFTGAFDVELLFLARKWSMKVFEMPIEWKHNETDRVDPVKDSLRMLRDIVRIRVAWFNGVYAK